MQIKKDLGSKVFDGIGSAGINLVLFVGLMFLQKPFYQLLGRPGLLTYGIVLMAVSLVCLDRAVRPRFPVTRQGWSGMIGGTLAWLVVYLSLQMEGISFSGMMPATLFLFVTLFAFVLSHRIPLIGLKFYCSTFLMGYFVYLCMNGVAHWTGRIRFIGEAWKMAGYISLPAGIIIIGWMIYYSEKRVDRLWMGVWLLFFSLLAVSVFWGNIIYYFV